MWIRRVIALAFIVVGAVWIAQGSGALHGSFMTGHAIWSVIGAFAALVGVVLLLSSRRRVASDDD